MSEFLPPDPERILNYQVAPFFPSKFLMPDGSVISDLTVAITETVVMQRSFMNKEYYDCY